MNTALIILLAIAVLGIFAVLLVVARKKVSLPSEYIREMAELKAQTNLLLNQQMQFKDTINSLSSQTVAIEARLKENSFKIKEDLIQDLNQAKIMLEGLKTEQRTAKQKEDEIYDVARDIHETLIGGRKRGLSGENILREAFNKFPQDIIQFDFKVKGKVVEYALVLPNKKRIPIDSKWPASELIEKLKDESYPRDKLLNEIEKKVMEKVKEAKEYIEPSSTVNQAMVALPDSVYFLCKKSHIEAHKNNVVLLPYSMSMPFILSVYNFYLQNMRSMNIQELDNYLTKIKSDIERIDGILENSVSRASVMIKNAYDELKNIVGKMNQDITFLYTSGEKEEDADRG